MLITIKAVDISFDTHRKMTILAGSKSVWDSSLSDLNEALQISHNADDYNLAIMTAAVACLALIPFTVLGNLLVISSFWKDPYKNLHSAPSNLLLTSLALSDFFVGAIQSPLTVYYWITSFANESPPFSFTILFSVNAFIGIVSILHLLALSIDRFMAVGKPLRYATIVTKRRAYIAAACIWVYSLVVGCASAALKTIAMSGTLILLHVIIPWIALSFLNARIMYTMRKASTILHLNVVNEQLKIFQKRERRVVNLVLLILGVYVLCYFPWFITVILGLTCSTCDITGLVYSYGFSGILLYVSPVVHPFLYAWRLPKFRDAFLYFFKSRSLESNERFNSKNTSVSIGYVQSNKL